MSGAPLDVLRLESPEAARLAVLASIAARLDRALLRELRLTLPTDADASIESDLWFSDVVQRRGSADIELETDALAALRDELRGSGALEAARAVVVRVRRVSPPLLALEEDLVYLGLTDAPAARIDERLGAAVATIREQPERALDVASWALRSLPRLPAAVRGSAAAWSLALGAEARTGYAADLRDQPPTLGGLAAALSADGVTVTVSVHRDEHGLALRDEAATGSSVMTVPATTPRIVEVEGVDSRRIVLLQPGGRAHVQIRDSELVVGNLRGERWSVDDPIEATPTARTIRYVVLPHLQADREREREIFERVGLLLEDLRRASFAPDLVFAVGDLTNRARSSAIADAGYWGDVVERMRRQLVNGFPYARVFLVPGAGDFRLPAGTALAEVAACAARGEPVVLDGPAADLFERGNTRRGLLPGEISVSLVIDAASIGVVTFNSALAASKAGPTWRQLATLCGGDRVDWARGHAFTFLITDLAPQHYPPAELRAADDAADLAIVARDGGEPDLRFFARGNERCGYRRGVVTVTGDAITSSQELRVWTRAGHYAPDRARPPREEAFTRRRRPAGPHARLVRDVVDLLSAGRRVVLTAPPGCNRAELVDGIRARLGSSREPVLAPTLDDAGDVEALRAEPAGAMLAIRPLLPYSAGEMRAALDVEVRGANDLDAADMADLCAGAADAGAVMRGSRGHPAVVAELLYELRSNPSLSIEDRGAELRGTWWHDRPLDIRSLPALEELDRCRRGSWSSTPTLGRSRAEDDAIWHLLAAGVLRRRGDRDALHWLPPPWLDEAWITAARRDLARRIEARRVVEVETRVEDAGDADVQAAAIALGHTIAATGWSAAIRSTSSLLDMVAAASREAGGESVRIARGEEAQAVILVGSRQGRRDGPLHLPVVSAPEVVRLAQRFLFAIDRMRSADDIVSELGASAGIGVIVDEVSRIARNRLTGTEIALHADEAPLLLFGAGAVAARRSARTKP